MTTDSELLASAKADLIDEYGRDHVIDENYQLIVTSGPCVGKFRLRGTTGGLMAAWGCAVFDEDNLVLVQWETFGRFSDARSWMHLMICTQQDILAARDDPDADHDSKEDR